MLGEINTSDAMESAISRMLNCRDAETVSSGWTIIRFLLSRDILSADILDLTRGRGWVFSFVSTLAYAGCLLAVMAV